MEQPQTFEQFLDYCPDSVKQWEDLLGISRQAIQEHRKNGNFVVEGQTVRNGLVAAFGYMRDTAAGRVRSEGNEELIAAKTEQVKVNTARQKLQLAREAGDLLPRVETTSFLTNLLITLKQELEDSFPATLSQEITIFYQTKIEPDFIKGHIVGAIERASRGIRQISNKQTV